MNGYDLSRNWFNFCFDNPEKIRPNHTALYFFAIEHCNRLGWKDKFGLPSSMAMEAIGIHTYNTYINTLKELVEWGFIKMVQKSKNQYSSNIVALSNFNEALYKAPSKALDKALSKHSTKHSTKQRKSTIESKVSIDKQINKETIEPLNLINKEQEYPPGSGHVNVTSLHSKFIEVYCNWYLRKVGAKYKMSGGPDGNAVKQMISYIKLAQKEKTGIDSTDIEVIGAWEFILENYAKWESFYQAQMKLAQINSNLPNIMANIRGISKSGNNITHQETHNEITRIIAAMGK